MNRILTTSLAASLACLALAASAPASAQTASGTITMTGTVAGKCVVLNNGLSATKPLGPLEDNDGTLAPSSNLVTAYGAPVTGQVNCTGSAHRVTLTANPIVSSGNAANVVAGYTNRVDYTAVATMKTIAVGGPGTSSLTAVSNGTATVSNATGIRLQNTSGNVSIAVTAFDDASSNLLLAGTDYSGTIDVNVAVIP